MHLAEDIGAHQAHNVEIAQRRVHQICRAQRQLHNSVRHHMVGVYEGVTCMSTAVQYGCCLARRREMVIVAFLTMLEVGDARLEAQSMLGGTLLDQIHECAV